MSEYIFSKISSILSHSPPSPPHPQTNVAPLPLWVQGVTHTWLQGMGRGGPSTGQSIGIHHLSPVLEHSGAGLGLLIPGTKNPRQFSSQNLDVLKSWLIFRQN
jgi:hypothetical protein